MKASKAFTLFLFAVILAAGFVAAVSFTFTPSNGLTFDVATTTKTFTLTNTGANATNFTLQNTTIVRTQDADTITYTITALGSLENIPQDGTVDVEVVLSGDIQAFDYGTYTDVLSVEADDGSDTLTNTLDLDFTRNFCEVGELATNNISISDIDVDNEGNSEDSEDDVWVLGDEVTIDVDVENLIDDEDLNDIIVEMGLFDSSGNNVADDLDFDDQDEEKQELGDIDEDEEETATFSFRVPPDFDPDNYKLVFKAYEDGDEDVICTEELFDETVDIDQENDEERFVIVDEVFLPEQITCGETVSGSFTLYNIGDEDQEKVLTTMKNADLGLDESFSVNDLDEGDDDTVSFVFTVPQTATNGPHTIDFRTRYDYDDGSYDEISEDTFFGFTTVIGCADTGVPGDNGDSPSTGPEVVVSAELGSEPQAGEELVIFSTVTNFGSELAVVSVSGQAFESWASLKSVTPQTLTLGAGQSSTVTFTFDVKEDVSGPESFIIQTNTGGLIGVQEVEVLVAGDDSSSSSFDFSFGDNNLIWIIAIVNIILIILIILVAVRLSRR